MLTWLATTDAKLAFVGEPISGRSSDKDKRATEDIMVVYCSSRSQGLCGGACTVYNGGATCLNAPGTNCLSATGNVAFCDHSNCHGSCNDFNDCGTRLDNNFCYTPGTNSIVVPAN